MDSFPRLLSKKSTYRHKIFRCEKFLSWASEALHFGISDLVNISDTALNSWASEHRYLSLDKEIYHSFLQQIAENILDVQ